MKLQVIKSFLVGVALVASVSSCSVATETLEVAVPTQVMEFEYNMEGGGNEQSVTLKVADILGSEVNIEDIEEASFKSITISNKDSLGLSEITQAKLVVLGESEDLTMVTVALADSIAAGATEATFSLIEDVELGKYLKEDNVTLLMDLTYVRDQDMLQNYEVDIKLNLEMRLKE